jgi:hypothetical protein
MTVQIIKINNENGNLPIYSPFSGVVAYEPETENSVSPYEVPAYDETVLFAYVGSAGLYDYVSPVLLKLLGKVDGYEIDLDPEELAQNIQIDNVIIFEINFGWNGFNYLGFMPTHQN